MKFITKILLFVFLFNSAIADDRLSPTPFSEDKNYSIDEINAFARKKYLPLPKKTKRTHSEVKQAIENLISQKRMKKIGEFNEEQVANDAEKKYAIWKKGDKINVRDRRGFYYSGKIQEITHGYIKVDNVKIYSIDFSEEIKTHLTVNSKKREAEIANYVSNKRKNYNQEEINIKSRWQLPFERSLYKQYGFVKIKDKWLDEKEYLDYLKLQIFNMKKRAYENQLYNAGWHQRYGKWISKEEADKMDAKLAKERVAEAEAEAKAKEKARENDDDYFLGEYVGNDEAIKKSYYYTVIKTCKMKAIGSGHANLAGIKYLKVLKGEKVYVEKYGIATCIVKEPNGQRYEIDTWNLKEK